MIKLSQENKVKERMEAKAKEDEEREARAKEERERREKREEERKIREEERRIREEEKRKKREELLANKATPENGAEEGKDEDIEDEDEDEEDDDEEDEDDEDDEDGEEEPPEEKKDAEEKKEVQVENGDGTSASSAPARGSKWEQMMAKKKESQFHADRERIRGRRGGGHKFVDEQIRKLIQVIKDNNIADSGLGTCKFGTLFTVTADTMPALAATLLQAKKRGIVKFEGDMLMQGTHDNVEVTLLTETVADTKIFRSAKFTPEEIQRRMQTEEGSIGPSNCTICSKTVYPTEKVVANKQVMHKSCFRCTQCNAILKLASYAFGNGKFYCEPHFQQLFQANSGHNF